MLVVTRDLVDPATTVPLLRLRPQGHAARVSSTATTARPAWSRTARSSRSCLPGPAAYLLLDVDRGGDLSGASDPRRHCRSCSGRGRTPLTIEEGIAVVTHAPALLEKNRCFMLSGSRRGDRRVPAMWISARAPKARLVLGMGTWHDWLGVASAGSRIA